MQVSLVIPCFHSGKPLVDLAHSLVEVANDLRISFELILVLDSRDTQTARTALEVTQLVPQARRLTLSKNFGQQAATVAGICASVGEVVVTLDDDHQHRASDAIAMAERLLTNPNLDLIYGVPTNKSQNSWRRISGWAFRRIMSASGLKFFHLFSPLRAFRGAFREAFRHTDGPGIAIDVVLGWVVSEVEGEKVSFRNRTVGTSGYSTFDRLKLAAKILSAYSTAPLTIGIYVGFAGVFFALLAGLYTILSYISGGIFVAGFTSTIILIIFLGSIQLTAIGLIGKYVGDQHRRGLGQPLYFVLQEPN